MVSISPLLPWRQDHDPAVGNPGVARKFFRAFSITDDHFYTTDLAEITAAHVIEHPAGYIFSTEQPSTVPLYRLFHPRASDHLYTTNEHERDICVRTRGYDKNVLIAGYVYPRSDLGGIPFYRMYNPCIKDHLYTTDIHEKNIATSSRGGYTDEGVVGYIFPYFADSL